MSMLQQIIAEESRIQEGEYSVGFFNRANHRFVIGNALYEPDEEGVSGVEGVDVSHLQFVRGKGIRKTEEADCSLCLVDGLNDGKWHDPKTMTRPAEKEEAA